jgi:DNA-binding NtrC family response regulator
VKVVLVVDEDASVRAKTLARLEAAGFNAWSADSWANLPSLLTKLDPVAMVVSENFAAISGKEVIASATKHWPAVKALIMTDDADLTGAFVRLGVQVAPRHDPDQIVKTLQAMLPI